MDMDKFFFFLAQKSCSEWSGNLTKLTNMCIGECLELEELPILTRLGYLKIINIKLLVFARP